MEKERRTQQEIHTNITDSSVTKTKVHSAVGPGWYFQRNIPEMTRVPEEKKITTEILYAYKINIDLRP